MNSEAEIIVNAFLGSVAFTSLLIVLALIGTLNPYHRPAIPLTAVTMTIFISTYLVSISLGESMDVLTTRNNLVNGALSILDLLYPAFAVLTALMMQASLRSRPDDPLIALSEVESGSE